MTRATVVLIGGGWSPVALRTIYGRLLGAAAGDRPTVACVVLDEGDGVEQFARYERALLDAGPCRPVPVLIAPGGVFDVAVLDTSDAVLVAGGLTPAYADALVPAAETIRRWVMDGHPYAGFSAGAAIAPASALVGGYRVDGRIVCPPDAGEDLEDVTVVRGLGLVPITVDVHANTWGTLSRAVAVVHAGLVESVICLEESTAIVFDAAGPEVLGDGTVWTVQHADGVVRLTAATAGS